MAPLVSAVVGAASVASKVKGAYDTVKGITSQFGGRQQAQPTDTAQSGAARGLEAYQRGTYGTTESQLNPLLESPGETPEYKQLTQDAIQRAITKANAQLGVQQSQQGVSGGEALLQTQRQGGDIAQELNMQDALRRRSEMLASREAKRSYLQGKTEAARKAGYGF